MTGCCREMVNIFLPALLNVLCEGKRHVYYKHFSPVFSIFTPPNHGDKTLMSLTLPVDWECLNAPRVFRSEAGANSFNLDNC